LCVPRPHIYVDFLTVQWGLENLLSDLDTHMLNLFGLFDCGGGGG
jgi:hypothetical protein